MCTDYYKVTNSVVLYLTEKLYVYPCEWNYRPDHCMYMSVCKTAEENGVYVVHGNRGVYHNDKQAAFKAIYQAVRDVSIPTNKTTCI